MPVACNGNKELIVPSIVTIHPVKEGFLVFKLENYFTTGVPLKEERSNAYNRCSNGYIFHLAEVSL